MKPQQILTLLAVLASSLCADTIAGTGTFQNLSGLTLDGSTASAGSAFWDNSSRDGSQKNIGYYMTGTGFFSGQPALAQQFYANGTGAADFSVTRNGIGNSATLLLEIAGNANINAFGWYDASAANPYTTLAPLFPGPVSPGGAGSSLMFSPTASFGFYLTDAQGRTFLSQSARNNGGRAGAQQFALFRELDVMNPVFFIAVEDIMAPDGVEGLGDYNDMVVRVSSVAGPDQAVPEPGTWLLTGAGLVAAGLLRRR